MTRNYPFLRFAPGVDWKDVNKNLLSDLNRLGAYLHKPLTVISGYRDRQQQAVLWARYVHSGYDQKYIAARPGQSMHEKGLAADVLIDGVPMAKAVSAQVLKKFGLATPVAGDYPHTQLASSPPESQVPGKPQQPSQQTPAAEPAMPSDQPAQEPAPVAQPSSVTPPILAPGSVGADDFSPRAVAELWQLVAPQSPTGQTYAQMAQLAAGGQVGR